MKTEKEKIYIVTNGCYSDYSIRAVFKDLNLAHAFMEQHYPNGDVEEHFIQTELEHDENLRQYYVRMKKNGDVVHLHIVALGPMIENDRQYITRTTDFKFNPKNGDFKWKTVYTDEYIFNVLTDKGKEGAIKIANERRAQLIANNQWKDEGTEYKENE